MKQILIVSAVLAFSSVAIACPNLAGSYSCSGEPNTITQTSGNPVTYTVTGSDGKGTQTFIADGSTQGGMNGMGYSATCDGSTLIVAMSIPGAPMSPEIRYSLDGSGNLIAETGMLMNGAYQSENKMTCAKQ